MDNRVYASSSGSEGKRMLGKEEKNKILVSTTAFFTGNNYSEVQIVILATTPFDISTAL